MEAPKLRIATVTLTAGGLVAVPAIATACSFCMDSIAYSTAPWLPFAFLILVMWLIADWATRKLIERHPMLDGRGMQDSNALIVVPMVSVTIVLFMGTGAFLAITSVYLAFRLVRQLWRPTWPLVGRGRLLAAVCALALMTVAISGIVKRARMDTFTVYDKLVWAGTGQSRNMSRDLGKDTSFEVESLRPMIADSNESRSDKAFEILRERENEQDLVRFATEVSRHLPETKSAKGLWWHRIYLSMWFDSLGLKHIETKGDLDAWLNQMDTQPQNPQTED